MRCLRSTRTAHPGSPAAAGLRRHDACSRARRRPQGARPQPNLVSHKLGPLAVPLACARRESAARPAYNPASSARMSWACVCRTATPLTAPRGTPHRMRARSERPRARCRQDGSKGRGGRGRQGRGGLVRRPPAARHEGRQRGRGEHLEDPAAAHEARDLDTARLGCAPFTPCSLVWHSCMCKSALCGPLSSAQPEVVGLGARRARRLLEFR